MLPLAEARRIALAAQGFHRPRPARVTVKHLDQTVRRIAPLQLDFVNVLLPAHFLIPFSRLGPYKRDALHTLLYGSGGFTEQWAHEAAVIPVETWPLLKHRMAEHRVRPYGIEPLLRRHREYAERMVAAIRERGPLSAADLPAPPESAAMLGDAWMGTFQRAVLEAEFGRGVLATANRLPNFARCYDLAEKLIPAEHRGRTCTREEAYRDLLLRAASAHGIGTAKDLADYYRLNIVEAKKTLAALAAEGKIEHVQVEGWTESAFLHPEAARPRKVIAAALLSPFDPLIWFRPRVQRLFDFDYRIEIYTPAAKRKYGYYVLPFLQGERLTARVDLKADRAAKTLRVMAAYCEECAKPEEVAAPLLAELHTLAKWLDLDSVAIERKGNLASRLCIS